MFFGKFSKLLPDIDAQAKLDISEKLTAMTRVAETMEFDRRYR